MLNEVLKQLISIGFESVLLLVIVYFGIKVLSKGLFNFLFTMIIGLVGLVLVAAIQFVPAEIPELYNITKADMEYMTDMQKKGTLDYEFGVELFFSESK